VSNFSILVVTLDRLCLVCSFNIHPRPVICFFITSNFFAYLHSIFHIWLFLILITILISVFLFLILKLRHMINAFHIPYMLFNFGFAHCHGP